MTTDTIKDMGPHFHRAADSLADTLARLDNARLERLQFLRRCSKDSTARLATLKEEIRTLPEQIAKWDAEAARLESQTAEDLLRQALEPAREAEEQPTMSCPSCKREYPDFDGAGVVFCDPKQGGCGFCRHIELKGQPMGDKTVMVCTACWEAQDEEKPTPAPTLLNLTKLPPGTVCEATKFFGIYNSGIMLNAGDRFRVVGQADGDLPVLIEVGGKDWWLSALVPARVVKEGGEDAQG